MPPRTLVVIGLTMLVLVVIAACTGDVVTDPTATPTHTPSYEELYEEAALAAAQRFFDAGNAHDIDGARRASTKDSFLVDDDFFEVQKALADTQFGESDYATFNITDLFTIYCTETRCELIVDIDKFYPSGDGGSIRIPIYVELEDGEWKYDWN